MGSVDKIVKARSLLNEAKSALAKNRLTAASTFAILAIKLCATDKDLRNGKIMEEARRIRDVDTALAGRNS